MISRNKTGLATSSHSLIRVCDIKQKYEQFNQWELARVNINAIFSQKILYKEWLKFKGDIECEAWDFFLHFIWLQTN